MCARMQARVCACVRLRVCPTAPPRPIVLRTLTAFSKPSLAGPTPVSPGADAVRRCMTLKQIETAS